MDIKKYFYFSCILTGVAFKSIVASHSELVENLDQRSKTFMPRINSQVFNRPIA